MTEYGRHPVGLAPILCGDEIDVVDQAATALRHGRIIGIPTDTVYGLAAAIDHHDALARLYTLKGRPLEKAIPVLLSDYTVLANVCSYVPVKATLLTERFWPGALTLVVPARRELPSQITAVGGRNRRTVAVRVPNHPLARAIIAAAGGALAVTSANRSGERPCLTATAVAGLAEAAPDLVIDGGPTESGVPSTIVSVSNRQVEVLRAGGISEDRIKEVLAPPPPSAAGCRRAV